jgi:outer membrane protein assembly factor BamB
MKRRWWKWFGVCAGLILCVEACLLMVEGPSGSDVPLRYRVSAWWDRMFGPPLRVTAVVNLTDVDINGRLTEALPAAAQGEAGASLDWPMFGGTPQRNMANPAAKNIPAEWSVEEGKHKNVKWVADLGTKSYGGPVIADGKVFFGTNNGNPRDKTIKDQKAVLMCFDEVNGKYLWQSVHDTTADGMVAPFGLCSTPCVEGKRHYYVTPLCQVICGDNENGKVLWRYDLMDKEKVVPYHLGNCSPLVVDDLVMVVTGNGNSEENTIPSPKAPSFMALHKDTGKPVWKSSLPGENIIDGQWSNPAVAVVGGKKQVIFPGGDCWLYSFDAKSGDLLWKCNCNPLRGTDKADMEFNPYFVSTPVVAGDRCFISMGVYPGDHPRPPRYSYVLCLDVSKKGDVSPKNLDGKDPANKGSALVWSFGGPINPAPKKGPRRVYFGRTISTCAIHDGLLYICEELGYMHCLDAQTGQRYWEDDFKATVWGSPYYADGKVFLATADAEVIVYQHGKKLKQLGRVDMGEPMHSTPVVANGVLYISTGLKLYAIAEKK